MFFISSFIFQIFRVKIPGREFDSDDDGLCADNDGHRADNNVGRAENYGRRADDDVRRADDNGRCACHIMDKDSRLE